LNLDKNFARSLARSLAREITRAGSESDESLAVSHSPAKNRNRFGIHPRAAQFDREQLLAATPFARITPEKIRKALAREGSCLSRREMRVRWMEH